MENSENNIEAIKGTSVTVRFLTDKPVKKTPYQVKGVFIKHFPDEKIIPLLDGQYRKRFLYPRVQVKVLHEQIYMIGVNEAVNTVLSFSKKVQTLDFGNITFQVQNIETEQHTEQFQPLDHLLKYRFITPWIALNQSTGCNYKSLNNTKKKYQLNQLLGQNLFFLSREMGIQINQKTYTKLFLKSLYPKQLDDNNLGAFYGEFQTNFILPNYIGIGNGITRGYGTIHGLNRHSGLMIDENIITKNLEKIDKVEINLSDPELTPIDTEHAKKLNNKTYSIKHGKRKKLIHVKTQKSFYKKKPKKQYASNVQVQKKITDESEFNSSKYHKKQHEIGYEKS